MRYMGGKFRQSKAIVQCLKPCFSENTVYVEPFCGGLWSAARIAKELRPGSMMLNDINKPLMLLWQKCLKEGCDWLPTDLQEVEQHYHEIKTAADDANPLTAWYGIACSFGGKWFGGVARNSHSDNGVGFEPQKRSTAEKVRAVGMCNPQFFVGSYENLGIPDGAVVYCDPPYAGRTKAHHFGTWDDSAFWQWVRDLSSRCTVFVSCFDCPSDFKVVYSWGDTVVRHLNSKGTDGTCEKLVQYIR